MSRENIIKEVRDALRHRNEIAAPPAQADDTTAGSTLGGDNMTALFVERYLAAGGTLTLCADEAQIAQAINAKREAVCNPTLGCATKNISEFLSAVGIADAEPMQTDKRYRMGVVLCEALLASSGSLLLSDRFSSPAGFGALPKSLLVVAFTSQVATDYEQALLRLTADGRQAPRNMVALQPNATGHLHDMHLILIEDQN